MSKIEIPYQHHMAAHCESGAVSSMLTHAGLPITEAMAFGISGALFFGYFKSPMFPQPMIVLRNSPGMIRKNVAKRLGLNFETKTFSDRDESFKELDRLLDKGIAPGMMVDFFYMKYLPEYSRVHFNAHYITVIGRDGDKYLISDSYSPATAWLDRKTLETARFAKGKFAPKGVLFYPTHLPQNPDFSTAIKKGIKSSAFYMLKIPLIPFLGVNGINHFAKKVLEIPNSKADKDKISHEMMLIAVTIEDRGTGGGAFRYLYASFLREASEILHNPALAELSKEMMVSGDRWREIALLAARLGKGRNLGPDPIGELAEKIRQRATDEKRIFQSLQKAI